MASFSRITPTQVEELSGLVFGLALSLSALQLAFRPPTYEADVVSYIIEFCISFGLLIWVWVSYIRIARNLRREHDGMLILNLLLLLVVALEPYLLYIVWTGTFDQGTTKAILDLSATAWGIDVGLMFVILGLMTHLVIRDSAHPFPAPAVEEIRRLAYWRYGCGAAMIATAFPIFWAISFSTGIVTGPVGTAPVILHLRSILWVPILGAAAFGSIYFVTRIDRVLPSEHRGARPARPERSAED